MSLNNCKIAAVAAVSDMARAREFYEGRLDLTQSRGRVSEGQVLYECGDGTGLLVYLSPLNAGNGTATLGAWEVENLDEEMDVLISKGVKFEVYDEPGLKTNEKGVAELEGAHVAWFKDPDGNTYALGDD